MQPATIVIDGECGLCRRAAAYGMGRGRPGLLRFVAQQDPEGTALLEAAGLREAARDTMVAVVGGRAYVRSSAVVQVAKRLRGWRRLHAALWLVPKPLRDAGYRFVAKRRHSWKSLEFSDCEAIPVNGSGQAPGQGSASLKSPWAHCNSRNCPSRLRYSPGASSSGMDPKQALVTGGTSGIGHAIATGLAREGHHLTLLVRSPERGATARQAIVAAAPEAVVDLVVCDLSDQASVRRAAAEVRKRRSRLDLLVHCAGVFLPKREVTPDGVEATLATNYLGPFLLTHELLPLLRKSAPARIVSVASRTGKARIDLDDLNLEKRSYSYLKAVPASKLAQVLFTQELAERLSGTGIVVNAAHPGLVARTRLLEQTGGPFRVITNLLGGTPEKGADTPLWLATSPETAHVTGGLWADRKLLKTPGQGSDPAARKRLWEESERLTGIATEAERLIPAA